MDLGQQSRQGFMSISRKKKLADRQHVPLQERIYLWVLMDTGRTIRVAYFGAFCFGPEAEQLFHGDHRFFVAAALLFMLSIMAIG